MFVKKHTRRLFVALLLIPLAALHAADGKPNILYILADDMGYGDAGFMGGKEIRTPALDELAHAGTILSSFYVQPLCSPTRSALMTGRYPTRTGVYSVVRPNAPWGLKLEERTLAQALREAGYATAIVGKWHLGEFQPGYRPTQRGFDHQYGLWFGAIDYFTHLRDGTLDWHRDDQLCKDEGYSTHLIAKEACRLIREKQADKPLFLYLPFNAVHGPYQVPDKYTQSYQALVGTRRAYAGMLSAMDEAVGQVVVALKETGLLDNTLIIFSSDNGGPSPGKITSNGPLRAGKGSIYEGGVRVCAFAVWPGHIPAGKTVSEPLHAVDWYPTLVKLAGGSIEQKLPLDGRNIWPVLTEGAPSPHDAILLCATHPKSAALRMGDWKLVHDGKEDELYNVITDLGEKQDLAASHPEKRRELRARLDALMKEGVAAGGAGGDANDIAKPRMRKKGAPLRRP